MLGSICIKPCLPSWVILCIVMPVLFILRTASRYSTLVSYLTSSTDKAWLLMLSYRTMRQLFQIEADGFAAATEVFGSCCEVCLPSV